MDNSSNTTAEDRISFTDQCAIACGAEPKCGFFEVDLKTGKCLLKSESWVAVANKLLQASGVVVGPPCGGIGNGWNGTVGEMALFESPQAEKVNSRKNSLLEKRARGTQDYTSLGAGTCTDAASVKFYVSGYSFGQEAGDTEKSLRIHTEFFILSVFLFGLFVVVCWYRGRAAASAAAVGRRLCV